MLHYTVLQEHELAHRAAVTLLMGGVDVLAQDDEVSRDPIVSAQPQLHHLVPPRRADVPRRWWQSPLETARRQTS